MASIEQITALLDTRLGPINTSVTALQNQIATLKREKPAHLLDLKDVRWKKEGNKRQYEESSKVWDNLDKIDTQVAELPDGDAKDNLKTSVTEGKEQVESRMRDILLANEWGWDFVTEYHAPPLALGDDDDTKIRKTKKAVEAKRLERAKKFKSNTGAKTFSSNQVKYMIQNALKEAGVSGISAANISNFSKPSADKAAKSFGGYNRYANYECNNCGVKGHIFSHCPARTGANSNTAGGGP